MNDRRRFLVQCGVALGAAGLGMEFLLDARQPGRTVSGPAALMSRDRFEALLNQWLSFRDPVSGNEMTAQLIAVHDRPGDAHLDQFSLLFRGRGDGRVPQGLYQVETRTAGGFDLFIVPVGNDANDPTYRADFSLLA